MSQDLAMTDDHYDRMAERNWKRDYLTMPGNRNFDRPGFKDYAMLLRPAENGSRPSLEQVWEEKRNITAKAGIKESYIQQVKDLESAAHFMNNTNLKSQLARLYRHVDLGIKAAEQDLEVKRNQLRSLCLAEEANYTREYIEKAQHRAQGVYEEKKRLAYDILKDQEQQRLDAVKKSLERVARENCEELRTQKSILLKKESSEVQKQQICEKLIEKERKAEGDKFWIEIWKKLDADKTRIEEEDERVRLTKMREVKDMLKKQIMGKELQNQEIKWLRKQEADFIDKLAERIREEERVEKEAKLEEKRELKKIMDAQLEADRYLKSKKKQEEWEYDKFFAEQLQNMILQEQMSTSDQRAQERLESELFRQQLKEVKAARAEEERQFDLLRKEETDKKAQSVNKNLETIRAKKEQSDKEVMETRAQQILDKQRRKQKEKQDEETTDAWSLYMLEKNKQFDRDRKNRMNKGAISDANNLMEQKNYETIRAVRKKREDAELLQEIQAEQEAAEELTRTFTPVLGELHPFTRSFDENKA